MKIAFDGRVLTHKHFTGVENYTKAIYHELKSLEIILLKPKTTNKILRHIWEHTILPFKTRKFDIVFAPANIAPIWKPKNTKLVVTLHDSAYLTYPKSISKLFYYYYLYAIPRALKIADRVITISEFSKQEIVKHYPFVKDKISVIYNGVDRDKFYPLDSTNREK
jgi:glycosyltransferase involved in cell wall biosynthesis